MHWLNNKFLISTGVVALILLYFFFDARKGFFPACPFYSITGFLCPGCGSQRAFSALLHGHFLEALQFNCLLIATLPLLLYSLAYRLSSRLRNRHRVQKIVYSPLFAKLLVGIICTFWLLRNLPAFSFLAPSTN